jgi:hypothetical protein
VKITIISSFPQPSASSRVQNPLGRHEQALMVVRGRVGNLLYKRGLRKYANILEIMEVMLLPE